MKTVLYTCPYIPAEWIAAHGFKPYRIIPHAVEIGVVGRQEGMCPYARAFVNEAMSRDGIDAVVMTTMCDQMRRAFELLVVDAPWPAILINVPTTWQSTVAQKLYMQELKRLGKFLVTLGGDEPSDKQLAKIMRKYESARKQINKVRPDIPAADHARLIEAFGCEGPPAVAELTDSMPESKAGIPLAIVGGPLMKQDFDVYDIVESHAGRIVFDATETAERGLCSPFEKAKLREDPVQALADAYFGGIRDASQRPNDQLHEWLADQCRTRGVRGIIYHRHVWCDSWHAELDRLRKSIDLPILDIEARSDGRSGEHRTPERILAFLEMLQ